MSIIKGKTNIVAGFGGTKRCIGEVYFSQSGLASDNPGALPGWTGEYYENGKTLFPDLYNFVKAHSELQVTKTQYDSAITSYGECPKYVVDENGETTTETAYKFSGAEPSALINIVKTQTPQAGDILYLMDATANEPYDLSTATQKTIEAVTYSDAGALTSYTTDGYKMNVRGTVTAVSIITTTPGTSLRLPKYANYIKMAGTEGITQKGAGLPDHDHITHGKGSTSGVYLSNIGSLCGRGGGETVSHADAPAATMRTGDASESNPIYGASDTVTPAHTTLYPWISAYTSAVPASTADFTGELNKKVSKSGDTMTGRLIFPGNTSVEFGSDQRKHYYITYGSVGELALYHIDENNVSKGLFINKDDPHEPYYYDGVNSYRLLTTKDLANVSANIAPDYSAASTAQAAEFTGTLSGKANTDLSNVLANYDYVVESQVNSDGSWYRKYKSGWLEQGGKLITGTGNYTFLKPYASLLNVTIQAMTTNDIGSTNSGAWLLSPGPTNTGFQILNNFSPTYWNSGYWYAVGTGV